MTAPLAISLPRLRSHVETLSRFGRNPDGRRHHPILLEPAP